MGPALEYKVNLIKNVIKKINYKFKIYIFPKNLNYIYNSADISIISGGNTLFNFCSFGKRNISISTNIYEKKNCQKMKKMKLTNYYGHYNKIKKEKFIKFIDNVINKKNNNTKFLKTNGVKEISKIVNS